MLLTNHGALTVGADLTTAYYRMETLELQAQISLVARLLGGVKDIDMNNINRLIGMRDQYGVTGKHPGYKKYTKK
jgi:L-fuculose-phosphate aldolase